jgi:hypothetical protein
MKSIAMDSSGTDSEEDLLQQAFPVDDDVEFDPTVAPSSGEEFLRLVRYKMLMSTQPSLCAGRGGSCFPVNQMQVRGPAMPKGNGGQRSSPALGCQRGCRRQYRERGVTYQSSLSQIFGVLIPLLFVLQDASKTVVADDMLPSQAWQRQAVASFVTMRQVRFEYDKTSRRATLHGNDRIGKQNKL